MDKLELKHLAPYLPYGLKIKLHNGNITTFQSISVSGFTNGISWMKECKPILRPLSDLTKEIEYNGERFIPMGKLHYKYCLTPSGKRTTKAKYEYVVDNNFIATYYGGGNYGNYGIKVYTLNYQLNSYRVMNWLFKWHFDVFGLIDKGLAIDINNLK